MQTQKKTSGLTVLLLLSLLVLSCLPCQTWSQVSPTPIRTVPVSTEQAESLISKLDEGLILDHEGYFTLRVSEEELTSFVALNMQESITDPQIIMTDGKVYLYGTMATPIEAPVAATCSVEMEGGQVRLTVEAVAIGGFPIPQTFVESYAQQLIDLVTSAERQGNADITDIETAEGELIIRGRVLS